MLRPLLSVLLLPVLILSANSDAADLQSKPSDPGFEKYEFIRAPEPGSLLLKKGDRLAIIGDSITEQKRYSRMIETYLSACTPDLGLSVRQFGWSGETAEGFLKRMEQDCLRFHPTIATLCYGMNDYKYRPYDEENAKWYREKYTAVVRKLTGSGARVIVGSSGSVGKVASWVKTASGTLEEHNLHLCALRNIALQIAKSEKVGFADNFWPMLALGFEASQRFGPEFELNGRDGVHPDGAGHLVMAYDFLHAMGLDGSIGTFTVDLKTNSATSSTGHLVEGFANSTLTLISKRYPFCATGPHDRSDSLRAGMDLVHFNQDLNRLVLIVRGTSAQNYEITWGDQSKTYSAEQLAKGINLAEDFEINPFSEAFQRVDEAVAAKQAFETKQIKQIFHGAEGKADLEAAVFKTESERAPLVSAITEAVQPVTHSIRITAQ